MSSSYFNGESVELDFEESDQSPQLRSQQNLLEYRARNRCVSCLWGNGRKKYTLGVSFILVIIVLGVVIGVTVDNEQAPHTTEAPTTEPPTKPRCDPLTLSKRSADKTPKRLLTTFGDNQTMELVSLRSSSSKTLDPPIKFPEHWMGSTGIQFDSENVLICGGDSNLGDKIDQICLSLHRSNDGTKTFFKNDGKLSLKEGRAYSASVMTPKGWWITGGLEVLIARVNTTFNSQITVKTTQLLHRDSSNSTLVMDVGPELPEDVAHHCAVQLDATHTLIAGGSGFDGQEFYNRSDAFIYDWTSNTWCETEPLNLQRRWHACVLLPDKKRVMIVGGMSNEGEDTSEEFLDLQSMKWTLTTELPVEASDPWLVEDDGQVLLVGAGHDGKQIWSFENEVWENTNRVLDVGRKSGLFLTVNEDQFVTSNL